MTLIRQSDESKTSHKNGNDSAKFDTAESAKFYTADSAKFDITESAEFDIQILTYSFVKKRTSSVPKFFSKRNASVVISVCSSVAPRTPNAARIRLSISDVGEK